MIRVAFEQIPSDKVDRLRAWMQQLTQRRDEVLETFAQEGTYDEQAYLIEGKDCPVLVYVMHCEDQQRAREAYRNSTLPIDLEHREVMKDICGERIDAELLWECSARD